MEATNERWGRHVGKAVHFPARRSWIECPSGPLFPAHSVADESPAHELKVERDGQFGWQASHIMLSLFDARTTLGEEEEGAQERTFPTSTVLSLTCLTSIF